MSCICQSGYDLICPVTRKLATGTRLKGNPVSSVERGWCSASRSRTLLGPMLLIACTAVDIRTMKAKA
jgi:hypothetical protein